MIESRSRHSGDHQIPVTYIWYDELTSGALGPEVPRAAAAAPDPHAPDPQPQTAT